MESALPRRNPKFRRKARAALAVAKSDMRVARLAARHRELKQATAAVVDAGEEVAKAIIYNAAYEDVMTFDYMRAGERIFLMKEDRLLGEHDNKQGSLIGIAIGFFMVQIAVSTRELEQAKRDAIAENPVPWMRKEFPNVETFLELAPRLEELRQGRYSGKPKTGKRGPPVTLREVRRLADTIGTLIDFSDWELDHFRWKKGELSRIQAGLPAVVREMNPRLEELKRQAAAAKMRRRPSGPPAERS